jgi:hypothetical protein
VSPRETPAVEPRAGHVRVELTIDIEAGTCRALFAEAPRPACIPGARLAPVISAEDGEEHVDASGVCRARLASPVDERPGASLRNAVTALTNAERVHDEEARRLFLRRGVAWALLALALKPGA